MKHELWEHQTNAIQALRDSVRQGVRRIVLMSPTGSGKSALSAAIVESALEKGKRVAFCVNAISLVTQIVEMFWHEGITDIGVIQARHEMEDWSKRVQVCSIQTLRRRKEFPKADIVIFDECHSLHERHKQWLTHPDWQDVPFIGLSATPYSKGLGKYFNTLLVAATTQELIDKGVLSPFRVFATGHPDLSGVKIVAGEYHEKQLSDAMMKGTLTADIVRTWQEKWGKGKTLAYGVDCAHAKAIQERFIQAGHTCGYQDAYTSESERREIKRKFHNGDYEIVSNVATLTTGVDFDCRCLILARPTRSLILFQQIIGRALRTAPGKKAAIILDHSDSTARLGFVTDIHIDHLDDGRDKPKSDKKPAPLPRECKSCTALLAPGVKVCPCCGTERKVGVSGIIEEDGELQEIKPHTLPKKKKGEKREYTMAEKGQFYAELKGYAAEKGYKEGFAAVKYKERFGGVWPDHSIKHVTPVTPSMTTRSWLRSRQIAFAKSKKYTEQHGAPNVES